MSGPKIMYEERATTIHIDLRTEHNLSTFISLPVWAHRGKTHSDRLVEPNDWQQDSVPSHYTDSLVAKAILWGNGASFTSDIHALASHSESSPLPSHSVEFGSDFGMPT